MPSLKSMKRKNPLTTKEIEDICYPLTPFSGYWWKLQRRRELDAVCCSSGAQWRYSSSSAGWRPRLRMDEMASIVLWMAWLAESPRTTPWVVPSPPTACLQPVANLAGAKLSWTASCFPRLRVPTQLPKLWFTTWWVWALRRRQCGMHRRNWTKGCDAAWDHGPYPFPGWDKPGGLSEKGFQPSLWDPSHARKKVRGGAEMRSSTSCFCFVSRGTLVQEQPKPPV